MIQQDNPWHDCGVHREGRPHVDQAEQDGRDWHWKPRVGWEYHQEGGDHDEDDEDDDGN